MPSRRDLNLEVYNIGKYAYRELHNFCLQYPEKKKQLNAIRFPYRSPSCSGEIHGKEPGDPTEKSAERADFLERDCILIEKTAKEAAGEYADCMLLSVTKDVPFHYLVLLKDLEIGEKKFMSMRRYFYFLLAQKKKII